MWVVGSYRSRGIWPKRAISVRAVMVMMVRATVRRTPIAMCRGEGEREVEEGGGLV